MMLRRKILLIIGITLMAVILGLYCAMEANNGEQGIRVAGENATDIVVPQLDGKQLADWLGSARPGTKVLPISGYTADAMIRHGISGDRIAFLEKPFTPEILAQRVRDSVGWPQVGAC